MPEPQKPSMFCPSLPLSCFHTTWWFALPTELFPFHILCLYSLCIPKCVKIIPCNFNSTCLCSNTHLWPLSGVCTGKNDGSEDICDSGRCVKVSWIVSVEWYFISWENPGTCSHNCFDPRPNLFQYNLILSFKMLWWPIKLLRLSAKSWIVVCCFQEAFLHLILIFICFPRWQLSVAFGVLCGWHLMCVENPLCIVYSPEMLWVLQIFP